MISLETAANQPSSDTLQVDRPWRKTFSFPVLLGILLVGFGFLNARLHIPGQESMLHAKIGKDILTTHSFPTTDSYSFTANGDDSIGFEWLSDLVMASFEQHGGLQGLMVLLILLTTAVVLLLYYFTCQRSRNSKAAFLSCLLAMPLLAPFLYLRAQLIGLAFLLITLICLERFRHGHPGALWILPGMFMVWVNIHATFVFGLFALGLYWVSGLKPIRLGGLRAETQTVNQRRQLLCVALLSFLALSITPYGTRLAAFPLEAFLRAPLGMTLIDEYQALGAVPILLKLFLALFLPFLIAVVVFRPVYRLEELALLVLTVYAGCMHRRFLMLFVVAFAPMLAAMLARWLPGYQPAQDKYVLNGILIFLSLLAMIKGFPSTKNLQEAVASAYPERAVDYMRQHPVPRPMFNQDSWGDYLIWKFDGTHKVFVDTRTVLYEGPGVFGDYARILAVDRDTMSLLRKYDFRSVLVDRGSGLATFLAARPDWERAYQDDLAVIFIRRSGPGGMLNAAPAQAARTPSP